MSNERSELINELASALSKLQEQMQSAIKDSSNPFFKSNYADLNSCWNACRPVLGKNNLCVTQTTHMVNEKLVLCTTLIHSSGQWMSSYLPIEPVKKDPQGIGAAISYMRRYGLSAMLGIVTEDADGEQAMQRSEQDMIEQQKKNAIKDARVSPQKQVETPPMQPPVEKVIVISAEQCLKLSELRLKVDAGCRKKFDDFMKDTLKVNCINDIPESYYSGLRQSMNLNIDFNNKEKGVVDA